MSRHPERQTRQRANHLTRLTPLGQERDSVDAGFLRRAGETASLLSTKPWREPKLKELTTVEGSALHRAASRRTSRFVSPPAWSELGETKRDEARKGNQDRHRPNPG